MSIWKIKEQKSCQLQVYWLKDKTFIFTVVIIGARIEIVGMYSLSSNKNVFYICI
jgi:hypothetical protein